MLAMPQTEGKFFLVAPDCVQWLVKDDGSLLLPIYFSEHHSPRLAALANEPANGVPRNVVGEHERVGIATTIDDAPVAAQHQPAKVPVAARVAHGHARPDPHQRMRTDDEQLLVRVVIRGAALDEDLVVQNCVRLVADVSAEMALSCP